MYTNYPRLCCCRLMIVVLTFTFSSIAVYGEQIVFNSIPSPIPGSGGNSLSSAQELGNVISLGESAAILSEAQVVFTDFNGSTSDAVLEYRLRLYDFVNLRSDPGDEIWSSPSQTIMVPPRQPLVDSIDIPQIQVPKTFIWTVEVLANESSRSYALPGYGPSSITVGETLGEYRLDRNTGQWGTSEFSRDTFGAQFTGIPVPEPACLWLAAFVIFGIANRSSRPNHDATVHSPG